MSARRRNLFCLPPLSQWFRSSSRDKTTRGHDPEASDLGINLSRVNDQDFDPEVRIRNKMRVKTNISKQQIKCVDEFDAVNYQTYKFCCPICLRYFNHMLVSSCCHNYICRFCIGSMAKKAKQTPGYVIRCCHCMTDDFKLTDV